LTGLHVSFVHVIFKNVVLPDQLKKRQGRPVASPPIGSEENIEDEYNDEF